ncbi:hypothetical protein [Flavobacterium sp.]|uniref:hypothetical protein n=1 Tax=Flavobacterium sp. TaxID=239 RepID=UPI003919A4EE
MNQLPVNEIYVTPFTMFLRKIVTAFRILTNKKTTVTIFNSATKQYEMHYYNMDKSEAAICCKMGLMKLSQDQDLQSKIKGILPENVLL